VIYLLKAGAIVRKVVPNEFDLLEKEMKDFAIGDSIERLGLK